MKRPGFTLIELLIYLAIVGLVTTALIRFILTISYVRNKNYAAQEVQGAARVALHEIERTIRRADGIVTSTSVFGSDPGTLVLNMAESAENPTTIDLTEDDGLLQVARGVDSPLALVSDEVRVSRFELTNLTSSSTHPHIQIVAEFTFKPQASGYEYSTVVTSSVSVRK